LTKWLVVPNMVQQLKFFHPHAYFEQLAISSTDQLRLGQSLFHSILTTRKTSVRQFLYHFTTKRAVSCNHCKKEKLLATMTCSHGYKQLLTSCLMNNSFQ